jgi:hypothetical protein
MATRKAKGTRQAVTMRRQGQQLTEWRKVETATAAYASKLPGAEVRYGALVNVIDEVDNILAGQALFPTNKQATSQRLRTLIHQGGTLSTPATAPSSK